MEPENKGWICFFRTKERAWNRKARPNEKCQDGRDDARGKRKAEQILGPEGDREFCLQNRVGTGTAPTYSPSM